MSQGCQQGSRTLWARGAASALTLSTLLSAVPAVVGADGASASADATFPAEPPPRPKPYTGGATGCELPDPTGPDGCLTGSTAWLLDAVEDGFGPLPVECWDEHAWNPSSDHSRGRACDYTFGRLGKFPGEEDVEHGWILAEWLRENARRLHVRYIIWQGQIWVRGDEDWSDYGGGGVYDPTDVTGGHYDHLHVSTRDKKPSH